MPIHNIFGAVIFVSKEHRLSNDYIYNKTILMLPFDTPWLKEIPHTLQIRPLAQKLLGGGG